MKTIESLLWFSIELLLDPAAAPLAAKHWVGAQRSPAAQRVRWTSTKLPATSIPISITVLYIFVWFIDSAYSQVLLGNWLSSDGASCLHFNQFLLPQQCTIVKCKAVESLSVWQRCFGIWSDNSSLSRCLICKDTAKIRSLSPCPSPRSNCCPPAGMYRLGPIRIRQSMCDSLSDLRRTA